jgi:hypothetical protein
LQGHHFLHRLAENEDIVVADLFLDLDIGAVERADGERAIEGELGRKTTFNRPFTRGSASMCAPTALIALMMALARS